MGNSFPSRRQQQTKTSSWTPVFAAVLLLLTVVSFFNYLLFHSAAEIFSIVIAFAMFTFCWNCRQFLRDNYLQFLGIAYLFVGTLDLTHTLAFPGLNVFGQGGLNLAAQIWLSARVLEAASLLAAAHLLGRKIPPAPVFALYSITVGVLLYAVFTQNVAPVWDPETEQLTAFKKLSEYIISVTLLGALGVFYRKRNKLNKGVLAFLAVSIIGTVLSEISFTAFRNADDPMNWLGHMLKIISFYFLYKAVIETGLRRPFALLFRDLEKNRSTIQQERALLEAVLQEMPDAIVTTDAEGETILANRAYSELITPEGASPDSSRRFFYQNGKPCPPSEVPLQRSLRTGEPMRNEQLEIRRGDGSFRTVLCHASPVRDQQGNLVAVVATHHDITERKRMEDALREARNRLEERVKERTRQLAAAEEQQRALANQWEETFDAMQDMVAIITPERKIVNANRTMADFFGQSREELKGTDCSELMQCQPVTSRNCPLEKSLKTNKRESSERFMKNRWFLVSADPVSDDEGATVGCVHILRDITAEKKAE
ncbi:MAG: PAS domain S-box protein, partial [Planctomycetes bacterium]|nr:PAS domain S-box protein [Planctomycetota bacterium]